jgi:hypothetical protein
VNKMRKSATSNKFPKITKLVEIFGAYLVMYSVLEWGPKVLLFPLQSNIYIFFSLMLLKTHGWTTGICIVYSRMAVLDFINVVVNSLAVKWLFSIAR